jgi:hypothetical protein
MLFSPRCINLTTWYSIGLLMNVYGYEIPYSARSIWQPMLPIEPSRTIGKSFRRKLLVARLLSYLSILELLRETFG